jgi:hypothetical protein
MLNDAVNERSRLELIDECYTGEVEQIGTILNSSMRVVQSITYIPVVLTIPCRQQVLRHMHEVRENRITKDGLREAMADGIELQFISRSHIYGYGAHLTGAEAVAARGPVGLEVRTTSGALIAVIEYAPHPAFGSAPVRAEVRGVVV